MSPRRLLPLLLILATAAPVAAQPRIRRPPRRPPPSLLVRVQQKLVPLELTRLQVEARVLGYIAETSLTMTFKNPNNRVLEGDLYFPLPEGAAVSGYALDIGGKLVDGVAVEKDKGRQVFEKIVRQGIDPGLVEYTRGSNFKTRVFPIPARGSRTIRVDYITDVVRRQGQAAYLLPLAFNQRVADVRLRVEVVKAVSRPLITAGGVAGLKFGKTRDSYLAEAQGKGLRLDRDLVVSLPDVQKRPVLLERAPDGVTYFAINHFPADPRTPAARAAGKAPRRITLFWDASASRAGADHQRELDLLKAYLGGLGQVTVELAIVRHAVTRRQTFEDTGALLAALRRVKYDGGTQLGSLAPPAGGADICLLFSDGISNFGREEPGELGCPLYIVNGQSTANHSFLRYLALRTGGEYFNLARLSDRQVLPAIGKPAFSFLGARAQRKGVNELYPSVPQPVRGRFTLVGKLVAGDANEVRLRFGALGRELAGASYRIAPGDAVRGDLLRRYWAQHKVSELSIFPRRNEQKILELGKRHGLVTPYTSLIVLDSLEQYVEHQIEPPASLAKMRDRYHKLMARQKDQVRQKEQGKLQAILKLWQGRVKWWQTRFRYPPNYRHREQPSKKSGRGVGRLGARRARSPRVLSARAAPAPEAALDAVMGGVGGAKEKKKDGKDGGRPAASIELKPWDPKTPYLAALKQARPQKRLQVYLAQRKKYGSSPAFFLDCGDFFLRNKQRKLALRVLSNVVELELQNAALVRVLAHKLAHVGELELAALLFREALRLRPEEPQSHRDLALVLARRAHQLRGRDRAAARQLYNEALTRLAHVVMNKWDRFDEIELIALMEFNASWPRARALGVKQVFLDRRLIKLLDVDIRIIMTWDADSTDMDMHVIEPSGEEAYYGHKRTVIGGNVSRDFTQGYGPEEYCLRRAMRGPYTVRTKFYGSSAAKLIGAVTLQVEVFTNYGRKNQKRKAITLRLTDRKETFTVGKIRF